MIQGYLTEGYFTDREREVRREWTPEEHRAMARRLLAPRYGSPSTDELRAAQVHATLALSLETARTVGVVPAHTHGPFPKAVRGPRAGGRREAG
ncbi:hypothetical protein [Saccharothrix xinjiangensis]